MERVKGQFVSNRHIGKLIMIDSYKEEHKILLRIKKVLKTQKGYAWTKGLRGDVIKAKSDNKNTGGKNWK